MLDTLSLMRQRDNAGGLVRIESERLGLRRNGFLQSGADILSDGYLDFFGTLAVGLILKFW